MKYNRAGTAQKNRQEKCSHSNLEGYIERVWYAPWLERFYWRCQNCFTSGYTKEDFPNFKDR